MPVSSGLKITSMRAVIYSLVSLAVGVGLVVLVVILAGSDQLEVKLGDDDFNAGSAQQAAETIAKDGPIPWAPLSRGRSIWIQHLGNDYRTGWYAFDVQSPEASPDCAVDWISDQRVFIDTCDPTLIYPQDGQGLTQFRVWLSDNNDLIVDVNAND